MDVTRHEWNRRQSIIHDQTKARLSLQSQQSYIDKCKTGQARNLSHEQRKLMHHLQQLQKEKRKYQDQGSCLLNPHACTPQAGSSKGYLGSGGSCRRMDSQASRNSLVKASQDSHHARPKSSQPSHHAPPKSPQPSHNSLLKAPHHSHHARPRSPQGSHHAPSKSPQSSHNSLVMAPQHSHHAPPKVSNHHPPKLVEPSDYFQLKSPQLLHHTPPKSPEPSHKSRPKSSHPSSQGPPKLVEPSDQLKSPQVSHHSRPKSPQPSHHARPKSSLSTSRGPPKLVEPSDHSKLKSPQPSHHARSKSPQPSQHSRPKSSQLSSHSRPKSSQPPKLIVSDHDDQLKSPQVSHHSRPKSPQVSHHSRPKSPQPSHITLRPKSSQHAGHNSPEPSHKVRPKSSQPAHRASPNSPHGSFHVQSKSMYHAALNTLTEKPTKGIATEQQKHNQGHLGIPGQPGHPKRAWHSPTPGGSTSSMHSKSSGHQAAASHHQIDGKSKVGSTKAGHGHVIPSTHAMRRGSQPNAQIVHHRDGHLSPDSVYFAAPANDHSKQRRATYAGIEAPEAMSFHSRPRQQSAPIMPNEREAEMHHHEDEEAKREAFMREHAGLDQETLEHYYQVLAEQEKLLQLENAQFELPTDVHHHGPLYTLNRSMHRKQKVLDALVKQLPHTASSYIDPYETLQCRYLRLTPDNIKDLEALCWEEGRDPGLHAHLTEEQVTQRLEEQRVREEEEALESQQHEYDSDDNEHEEELMVQYL